MKKALITLLALAPLAGLADADVIFGGDFQLYKPGTDPKYTVTGELDDPGPFTSYAQGVGDGVNIAGTGIVNFSDATSGDTADLPGWVIRHGNGTDTGKNGVDGSSGISIFAAWSGQVRIETDAPVGTAAANSIYTITAMVDGYGGGPVNGSLVFDLMADGVALTPTSESGTPVPGDSGFKKWSRTYDTAALADHIGKDLTIILGVGDDNTNGGRMIWDDVSLDVELTGPAPVFAITKIVYDQDADTVTLTWRKTAAESYIAKYSRDMIAVGEPPTAWGADIGDGITAANDEDPGDGDHITVTFPLESGLELESDLFFRIEEE